MVYENPEDEKEFQRKYHIYYRMRFVEYADRHKEQYSRYTRNRYRNDPIFRERRKANSRRYQHGHREKELKRKRNYILRKKIFNTLDTKKKKNGRRLR